MLFVHFGAGHFFEQLESLFIFCIRQYGDLAKGRGREEWMSKRRVWSHLHDMFKKSIALLFLVEQCNKDWILKSQHFVASSSLPPLWLPFGPSSIRLFWDQWLVVVWLLFFPSSRIATSAHAKETRAPSKEQTCLSFQHTGNRWSLLSNLTSTKVVIPNVLTPFGTSWSKACLSSCPIFVYASLSTNRIAMGGVKKEKSLLAGQHLIWLCRAPTWKEIAFTRSISTHYSRHGNKWIFSSFMVRVSIPTTLWPGLNGSITVWSLYDLNPWIII